MPPLSVAPLPDILSEAAIHEWLSLLSKSISDRAQRMETIESWTVDAHEIVAGGLLRAMEWLEFHQPGRHEIIVPEEGLFGWMVVLAHLKTSRMVFLMKLLNERQPGFASDLLALSDSIVSEGQIEAP